MDPELAETSLDPLIETWGATMADPSTTDFFDAAQWVYRDGGQLPADLTQLQNANGADVTSQTAKHGFYGAAFETSSNQVIVAFEGTDLGGIDAHPAFVKAQLKADVQIYHGENPDAYRDALRFTRRVLAVAEAQGISADDVFVAGHSLGGAEAEFVAARTGLGGATFGAPGIPSTDTGPASGSNLTDYVDYGDPVGNYSSNPNHEGNFLSSDSIVRFGHAKYVGDPSTVGDLELAGQLYGTSDLGDATALGILGNAAVNHHPLQDYAADLRIQPASAQPAWMSNLDASQLSAIVAQFISGGVGSAPLAQAVNDPFETALGDWAQASGTRFGTGHAHVETGDEAAALGGSGTSMPHDRRLHG